jgi:uncharacterized protein (DUF58 family)
MWLYTIAFPIGVLIIVGSFFAGGVYTLVAIPVILVALAAGVALRAIGRATVDRRLPGEAENPSAATPADLVDARRAQQ